MSSESHSVRRRHHGLILCRWVLVGLASYWVVWTELTRILVILHDSQSQSVSFIADPNYGQERLQIQPQNHEHPEIIGQEKQQTERGQHEEEESNNPRSNNPRSREAKSRKNKANAEEEEFFDWTFWGLCIIFTLMSIVRIRLEPSRRRRRLVPATSATRTAEANAVQTLRRINRARQERGEPPISFDVYQALLMALLQDRTLLQGLAGHAIPPPPRGATEQQLLMCQQLTITHNDDYDGDCSICLASYQPDDVVRILPCSHSYHKGCIDVWLQQSILCPMCKQSLDDTEPPI